MAKKHNFNECAMLFINIADAARAIVVSQAMEDYKDNWSVIAPKPMEHLLAKLLGVDPHWVVMWGAVVNGKISGGLLVGADTEQSVILAQAMIVKKHGYIQHPLRDSPEPIHPFEKNKIDLFSKSPSKMPPLKSK